MKAGKILFVEDNMDIGYLVSKGLEKAGFDVSFINTLTGFREVLVAFQPHLVLLDLEVGDRNSADEIPYIRAAYPRLPIIIASSHTSGKEIGNCLNAGADYYIKKPYELEELLPLIYRFCSADNEGTPECIRFGHYRLNPANHELYYKQQLIHSLNPKEFQLLYLLASHPREIVKRTDILQQIWQNEGAGESLNNYITYLRNYLKKDSTIEIKTIKGIGYCFLFPPES